MIQIHFTTFFILNDISLVSYENVWTKFETLGHIVYEEKSFVHKCIETKGQVGRGGGKKIYVTVMQI